MVTQADGRLSGYETDREDAMDDRAVNADAHPPEAKEDAGAAEALRQARVPAFWPKRSDLL